MDHQLEIWAMHILAFATDPTQEFYILSQSNLKYFFAFNKLKWKYISGLWQSLLPFQVGQEAMFCNSGTTLLYLVLHFFSPPTNFYLGDHFSIVLFCYLFHLIISSMFNSASMLHSSHIFLIWFEGHPISVLMILNHLVGNKICILCNFIPYSCARLHSGLLMISATALGHPLSFIFYPLSFLFIMNENEKYTVASS